MNPISISLNDLIESVENAEILAPEMIQRGFVWGKSKVYDLFESIFKNYPIGIIILWEISDEIKRKIIQEEETPIGFKPLIETGKPTNPKYFVVDGLQRLISFVLFKRGEVKVLYKHKEYVKKEINIYYNPDTNQIGLRKSDVGNPAVLLSDIFNDNLDKYENLSGKQKDKLFNLKHSVLKYSVPVYILKSSYDIIDIANIFDRINSKGTRVVLAQIITAYLAVILKDVAVDLWNYVKSLRNRDLAINITTPAKSLSYLITGTTQVKVLLDKMSKGHVKQDKVKETWKNLKKAYDNALMILQEHLGITSTRILPSETPLTALSIILYKIDMEYKVKRNLDFNKALAYWFALASFHRYYTGSTEVKLDGDIKAVDNVLKKKGKLNEIIGELISRLERVVGSLEITEDRIRDMTSRERRTKFLLYIALYMNKAIDWFTGNYIMTIPWKYIHLHHIFPRKKKPQKYVDNIGNLTFISGDTNKKIRDKDPLEYFEELYKDLESRLKNKKDIQESFRKMLRSHFIPVDKRKWKSLRKLVEYRRKEIANFLTQTIVKYIQEYTKY